MWAPLNTQFEGPVMVTHFDVVGHPIERGVELKEGRRGAAVVKTV